MAAVAFGNVLNHRLESQNDSDPSAAEWMLFTQHEEALNLLARLHQSSWVTGCIISEQ